MKWGLLLSAGALVLSACSSQNTLNTSSSLQSASSTSQPAAAAPTLAQEPSNSPNELTQTKSGYSCEFSAVFVSGDGISTPRSYCADSLHSIVHSNEVELGFTRAGERIVLKEIQVSPLGQLLDSNGNRFYVHYVLEELDASNHVAYSSDVWDGDTSGEWFGIQVSAHCETARNCER
jgi:hypothetical protein